MLLSLTIPAYNEERRIRKTLEDFLSVFQRDVEILVVTNGCTDHTVKIVQAVERANPIVRLINIPEKAGKGAAVRRGFAESRGDIIGFVDADGATSATELKKLLQSLDAFDGVIASRWVAGAKVSDRSFVRTIVSRLFRICVFLLFRLPFRDTQCGAKLFRRTVIDRLLPDLRITNMVFDVELLYLAWKRGFRIREAPTIWVDQSSSALLGSPLKLLLTSARMFFTLLQLRFRHV